MAKISIERGQLEKLIQQTEALHQEVQQLNNQVQFLSDQARANERRQEMWDDLYEELMPISKEMMATAMVDFATLEKRGYFDFALEGAKVVDRVVTSFTPEDVRQLGENIVLILNTVKAMTQPEIMAITNNLTAGLVEAEQHPERLPTSLFGLLKQMRDPDVRRGLAVAMAVLRTITQHPMPETLVNTN